MEPGRTLGSMTDIVIQILVTALCATVSAVVALAAGILARFDGASHAGAVRRSGAAFGGALALGLAVVAALGGL